MCRLDHRPGVGVVGQGLGEDALGQQPFEPALERLALPDGQQQFEPAAEVVEPEPVTGEFSAITLNADEPSPVDGASAHATQN